VSSDNAYLTLLGTGTSVGVPVIGCRCPVCASTDPRNNRTRSSLFVTDGETHILIDSGPDLREQALREKLPGIDAVLYTHSHVDHVVGFDELRAFCWGKPEPLPLYGTESCLEVLKSMFTWAFHSDNRHGGYVKPDPRIISSEFKIGTFTILPLPVIHGTVETTGFRLDTANGFKFAYLPDVKSIPVETMKKLQELDLLIIDALRDNSHSTHLSVSEAIAISNELSPRKTILTHLSHELNHGTLAERLPPNISPAYDGLKIPLKTDHTT